MRKVLTDGLIIGSIKLNLIVDKMENISKIKRDCCRFFQVLHLIKKMKILCIYVCYINITVLIKMLKILGTFLNKFDGYWDIFSHQNPHQICQISRRDMWVYQCFVLFWCFLFLWFNIFNQIRLQWRKLELAFIS